ncbi:MAG: FAD-dependent oxidoreductase [Solirubrobacteraceae bacterium]
MAAERAYEMNIGLAITIVTPERAPLAAFGPAASQAVAERLGEHRIETITGATCEVHTPGTVSIHPSGRELKADQLIALPELFGPSVAGVPLGPAGGFIPIDQYCRVARLDRVFAAGDATAYKIKLGGVAAQQADVAAQSIAALAGAPLTPQRLNIALDALLLGGGPPLRLSAAWSGSVGTSSRVALAAEGERSTKIFARYLTPYLELSCGDLAQSSETQLAGPC